MIIVRLSGGLGNQMFQFAAAKKTALFHKVELKSDLAEYQINNLRKYELGCFELSLPEASVKEIKKIIPSGKSVSWKSITNKLFFRSGSYKYIKQPHFLFQYYPEIETASSSTYLDGYWQSEKYFKDIDSQIRKDFTFKESLTGKNEILSKKILSENAVAIHVRRGDYAINDTTKEFHGQCSVQYYQKSIDYILQKVEKPIFYVFSDEPEWAENNLKTITGSVKIVDYNKHNKSFDDMQLMSLCKHNIIANSSFSWWAAWLNTNPDKIIIAPKNWFNPESKWFKQYKINTADILPDNWIRIRN